MINDDVRKMFLWLQSKTKWSSVTQSLEDDDGVDSGDSDNDDHGTNSGFRRSPPSVRSATMATNKIVGTTTFQFIKMILKEA